jgi:hypothetical protein
VTHMTSAILAGLGAVFGLAGLLFYWASGRAFERAFERAYDDPRSSDPFGDATRGAGAAPCSSSRSGSGPVRSRAWWRAGSCT